MIETTKDAQGFSEHDINRAQAVIVHVIILYQVQASDDPLPGMNHTVVPDKDYGFCNPKSHYVFWICWVNLADWAAIH